MNSNRGLTVGDDAVRCTFCHETERLYVAVDTAIGRVTIRCWACGETSYRVSLIRDVSGRVVAPPQSTSLPRSAGPWNFNRRQSS